MASSAARSRCCIASRSSVFVVVVAQKVQRAVDQQEGEFSAQGDYPVEKPAALPGAGRPLCRPGAAARRRARANRRASRVRRLPGLPHPSQCPECCAENDRTSVVWSRPRYSRFKSRTVSSSVISRLTWPEESGASTWASPCRMVATHQSVGGTSASPSTRTACTETVISGSGFVGISRFRTSPEDYTQSGVAMVAIAAWRSASDLFRRRQFPTTNLGVSAAEFRPAARPTGTP